MDRTADLSTREIAGSRLQLADDLVFTPQVHGQEIFYHLESPRQGSFYRLGYPEYVFVSLLDGRLTVAQALTVSARTLGAQALTQAQGLQVVHWLLANGLACFAERGTAWAPPAGTERASRFWQNLNPFGMKLSLGSPDGLLAMLLPLGGWLCSPLATLLGVALIAAGGVSLLTQWTAFAASAGQVFTPHNWLVLAACWLLLKVVHELAHGLACKYYGGEVRDAGLMFVLLAPMAYVDVTSCWRFPSRWQRIHVAAAGMYAELLLAAIAALGWSHVESPVARNFLHSAIAMASVSTLLCNANPLMRFDGYYILSDLLGIPNLATDGARFVQELAGRVFYGTRPRPPQVLGWRRWCVRAYGLASGLWRIVICCSLLTAGAVLLHGAGVILSLGAMAIWLGAPLVRLGTDLWQRYHEARGTFVRAVLLGTLAAAALAGVLGWAPWPATLTAPAIVEYADSAVVRSRAAGFVARIHVAEGETVAPGTLLVELRNDELLAELRELELESAAKQLKHRLAVEQQDAAAAQIAAHNWQATVERLEATQRRAAALQIRAPAGGRVVARHLQQRLGTYVHEGDEVLVVGDEGQKQLTLSAGQSEIDALLPLVGSSVWFRSGAGRLQTGTLLRMEPRASADLPHPALGAAAGGPLAVEETAATASQPAALRLTEPRFRGTMELSPEVGRVLGVGERGYAIFGIRRERVGEYLWVQCSRWMETLLLGAARK